MRSELIAVKSSRTQIISLVFTVVESFFADNKPFGGSVAEGNFYSCADFVFLIRRIIEYLVYFAITYIYDYFVYHTESIPSRIQCARTRLSIIGKLSILPSA